MVIAELSRKRLIIPPYADEDFCAKTPDSYQEIAVIKFLRQFRDGAFCQLDLTPISTA